MRCEQHILSDRWRASILPILQLAGAYSTDWVEEEERNEDTHIQQYSLSFSTKITSKVRNIYMENFHLISSLRFGKQSSNFFFLQLCDGTSAGPAPNLLNSSTLSLCTGQSCSGCLLSSCHPCQHPADPHASLDILSYGLLLLHSGKHTFHS